MKSLTFAQAKAFIYSTKWLGSKPGLNRIGRLCQLLHHPQNKLQFIHVAGTNGKGSTCAMMASMLRQAGLTVGLFTSPYLQDVRECFVVNGKKMTAQDFADCAQILYTASQTMKQEGDPPTEYELLTALAFIYFLQKKCDIVVLETGLGGRLDSTNIIPTPLCSVITSISMDHMAYLGDTISAIAQEKCGIIKPRGTTVTTSNQDTSVVDVINQYCQNKQNPLIQPDPSQLKIVKQNLSSSTFVYQGSQYRVALGGKHQVENALVAITTLQTLSDQGKIAIDQKAMALGLARVSHGARCQVLSRSPLIVLDGAHNLSGASVLHDYIKQNIHQRPLVLIMGMLTDKEYAQCVLALTPLADVFFAVTPDTPRALPANDLAACAKGLCSHVEACDDYVSAVSKALKASGNSGAVVICGSLYQASAMRKIVKKLIKRT